MAKLVITGGGTMGHITPHITMEKDYKKEFDSILYIGGKDSIEQSVAQRLNIPFVAITTTKLIRKKLWKNLAIPFKLRQGKKEAKKLLQEFKPDVIFSKGGYVSVPVVLAAKSLRIPIVAHESDLSVGLANKICAKHCNTMFTTFPETAKKLKNGCYCGAPIKMVYKKTNEQIKIENNLNNYQKIMLITGGSQGAVPINKTVEKILPLLCAKHQVLHQTGKNYQPNFKHKNYHPFEFTSNMQELIQIADMVISRAGSNTIFELLYQQKPMLLLPLPKGNSRGDQVQNASYFASKGYAVVIPSEELNAKSLEKGIKKVEALASTLKNNMPKQTNSACETIIAKLKEFKES